MPKCFLLLLRSWVYVDRVLARCLETRIFHKFKETATVNTKIGGEQRQKTMNLHRNDSGDSAQTNTHAHDVLVRCVSLREVRHGIPNEHDDGEEAQLDEIQNDMNLPSHTGKDGGMSVRNLSTVSRPKKHVKVRSKNALASLGITRSTARDVNRAVRLIPEVQTIHHEIVLQ